MQKGLAYVEEKTGGIAPVVRAALVSFGFVFIHPFLDGNGRIHRFLIHDMLTRDRVVDDEIIIPVSAHMVNNLRDYDAVLEAFSRPLMRRVQFVRNDNGQVTITNPEEVKAYFQYPDLTAHVKYLAETISAAIRYDLSDELFFLERYDEVKKGLQQLIDMPDKRANDIIVFIHQNKGTFPARRKRNFPEISDAEFAQIEELYNHHFK